tara:strand:- start:4423 stop:5283 length:861 start_codon:yes stop_codon:yes gene_type:complete
MKSFTEKYRPQDFNSICGKTKFAVLKKRYDNLILYGKSGHGKSTLIRVFLKDIPKDSVFVSSKFKYDTSKMLEKMKYFVKFKTSSHKIVYFDEIDTISMNTQREIENVMKNSNVTFYFTCNDLSKISRNIQHDCTVFECGSLTFDDIKESIKNICSMENIEFNDDFQKIFRIVKCDYRKFLSSIQLLSEVFNNISVENYYTLFQKQLTCSDVVNMIETNTNIARIVELVYEDCIRIEEFCETIIEKYPSFDKDFLYDIKNKSRKVDDMRNIITVLMRKIKEYHVPK